MGRAARWALALLLAVAAPSWGQRLLIGTWQGRLDQSTATLTIITADGDGSVHGILRYDPPQPDGFAGSPFTTHIENGTFSIRLFNGTSYAGMHWCRDQLCGVFHAPDDLPPPRWTSRGRTVSDCNDIRLTLNCRLWDRFWFATSMMY